jgi:hypothetical protein
MLSMFSRLMMMVIVTTKLGVTKEIMSRGPHVVDMECREPNG